MTINTFNSTLILASVVAIFGALLSILLVRHGLQHLLNLLFGNIPLKPQEQNQILQVSKELEQQIRNVSQHSMQLELANKSLEETNQQLEKANKAKSDFVNVVSHELRTPLTSIKSFTEILREDIDELDRESQLRFLTIIDEESARLTRLINDLLDLQRVDAGNMMWRDQQKDLNQIIRDCIEFFSPAFDNKGVSLESDMPPADDHFPITIDPDKIKQVITNLLSNALKFSEKGTVTVSLVRIYPQHPLAFSCSHQQDLNNLQELLKKRGIPIQNYQENTDELSNDDIIPLIYIDKLHAEGKMVSPISTVANSNDVITESTEKSEIDNIDIDELQIIKVNGQQSKEELQSIVEEAFNNHDLTHCNYQINVKDSGIGIPEDEIDYVFERFHQVKESSGEAGGSGLGLAICLEYIEHYQGSISVTSKLGEGSTFTITLPAKTTPRRPLGELLVEAGLVSREDVESALKQQKSTYR